MVPNDRTIFKNWSYDGGIPDSNSDGRKTSAFKIVQTSIGSCANVVNMQLPRQVTWTWSLQASAASLHPHLISNKLALFRDTNIPVKIMLGMHLNIVRFLWPVRYLLQCAVNALWTALAAPEKWACFERMIVICLFCQRAHI